MNLGLGRAREFFKGGSNNMTIRKICRFEFYKK